MIYNQAKVEEERQNKGKIRKSEQSRSTSESSPESRKGGGQMEAVSVKLHGLDGRAAVSEVAVRSDGDDLIVETRFTLFGGMTHIRNGGITRYLDNATRDLMCDAADRAVALLESEAANGGGTEPEPVLP